MQNFELTYCSMKRLEELTGQRKRTIQKKKAGIQREIENKRYPRSAIAGHLISLCVYIDYLTYEKALADKNLRKTVPSFESQRKEILKLLGVEYEAMMETMNSY